MDDDKNKLKIVNKFPTFGRLSSAKQNGTKCNKNELEISDITKDLTRDIISWKLQKNQQILRQNGFEETKFLAYWKL